VAPATFGTDLGDAFIGRVRATTCEQPSLGELPRGSAAHIYVVQSSTAQRATFNWLGPDYALSLNQWRFAVDKASSGESVPFPLALIAAAQRSAAEGDYRRAVFDAASAAETALKEALERALKPEGISSDFYGWAMQGKAFAPSLTSVRELASHCRTTLREAGPDAQQGDAPQRYS
jgi:hypothetical protein